MKVILWCIAMLLLVIAIFVFAALHGPVILPAILLTVVYVVGRIWLAK